MRPGGGGNEDCEGSTCIALEFVASNRGTEPRLLISRPGQAAARNEFQAQVGLAVMVADRMDLDDMRVL